MSSRLILSGLRSIEECLQNNPERISKLLMPTGKLNPRLVKIREIAEKQGIRIETNPKFDPNEPVLAMLRDYQYADFGDVMGELKSSIAEGKHPVVLVLDGITDPHNLGAIIRTAAFMGMPAIILPKDRSVAVTDTVYRIASGGLEHIQVAQVTNIVTALQDLKDIGFWSIGFSEHADKDLTQVQRDFPAVIVIGNEEKGIRPLVSKNCDYLVQLQGKGGLKSLNASVASALAMAWATGMFKD